MLAHETLVGVELAGHGSVLRLNGERLLAQRLVLVAQLLYLRFQIGEVVLFAHTRVRRGLAVLDAATLLLCNLYLVLGQLGCDCGVVGVEIGRRHCLQLYR